MDMEIFDKLLDYHEEERWLEEDEEFNYAESSGSSGKSIEIKPARHNDKITGLFYGGLEREIEKPEESIDEWSRRIRLSRKRFSKRDDSGFKIIKENCLTETRPKTSLLSEKIRSDTDELEFMINRRRLCKLKSKC